MPQYFELSNREKKQEYSLLFLALLSFAIMGKGIYNDYSHINQDNILVPLYIVIAAVFALIYGLNGLQHGNVAPKWTPFYIYSLLLFITRRLSGRDEQRARIIVKEILGVAGIMVSGGLLVIAILKLSNKI